MKKILLLTLLFGCSPKITKLDVDKARVEVCNDLVNLFIPPQLEKSCYRNIQNDKIIVVIKNPTNGQQFEYDSKTGELLQ